MRISELVGLVLGSPPGSRDFIDASRALAVLAFSTDPAVAQAATKAIFVDIVEPWSDRFVPELCDAYVVFMSEVLYSPGSPVAAELANLGLPGPSELRARYCSIRAASGPDRLDFSKVRAVVVLSRVTLGADVAVTSAVVRAGLRAFPSASVYFIAPDKNLALLTGEERVAGRAISYGRSALLADRLTAWVELRERVREIADGLGPAESIVIDPDSRLTQLGLLPIADDRYYRFFESRSWSAGTHIPLGRIAAGWCSSMWNIDIEAAGSFVQLRSAEEALCDRLEADPTCRVATVSFGVGGRAAKRLDGAFEDGLLELLRKRQYLTVLDHGAGESEARLAEDRFRAFSGSKSHRDEGDPTPFKRSDLMTWKGSIHGFGRLIRASRLYIGYDSAAAHLAAAQGVPVISVFAGAPSEVFRQRWTPWGPGPVRVIPADGPQDGPAVLSSIEKSLAEVEAFDG